MRDQLNPRLDDGREDRHNLSGLNSLPEIQTILAAYVDSKTVTEVALVLGGFRWFEVVLGGFDSKPVTEIDLVLGGYRWF